MRLPEYNLDPPEDGPDFDDLSDYDLAELIGILEGATEDGDIPRRKRHDVEAVLRAATDELRHRRGHSPMRLSVIKLGYSSNPWRLVDDSMTEVALPSGFEHPLLGRTTIRRPIMGRTKKECIAEALMLLGNLIDAKV